MAQNEILLITFKPFITPGMTEEEVQIREEFWAAHWAKNECAAELYDED